MRDKTSRLSAAYRAFPSIAAILQQPEYFPDFRMMFLGDQRFRKLLDLITATVTLVPAR